MDIINHNGILSQRAMNSLAEQVRVDASHGGGGMSTNVTGGTPIYVPTPEPRRYVTARITGMAMKEDGVTPLLDCNCRLQYTWIEEERFIDSSGCGGWREATCVPLDLYRGSMDPDDPANPCPGKYMHLAHEANNAVAYTGEHVIMWAGAVDQVNTGSWEHVFYRPSDKPIRVKVLRDWYGCQVSYGAQVKIQLCAKDTKCPTEPSGGCEPCESCETCSDCQPCHDCTDPCNGCPSCEPNSCETPSEAPSVPSSGGTSSGDSSGESGSSGYEPFAGMLGVVECTPTNTGNNCVAVPSEVCNAPAYCSGASADPDTATELPVTDCEGVIYLADPLSTINEHNLLAVKDGSEWYIAEGTCLYVQHLDDAWDLKGHPLYEPVGSFGTGCACKCKSCDSVLCPSCEQCPSCGGSCPSCESCNNSASCSCSHVPPCNSCPSGGSSGGSQSGGSSGGNSGGCCLPSGCECVPGCPPGFHPQWVPNQFGDVFLMCCGVDANSMGKMTNIAAPPQPDQDMLTTLLADERVKTVLREVLAELTAS